MALIRWEPAAELNTLQNEMNRLFSSFVDTPIRASSGEARRLWIPAMDLVESDDQYVLRADLPGLSDEDIKIEFESGVLTISDSRSIRSRARRRCARFCSSSGVTPPAYDAGTRVCQG